MSEDWFEEDEQKLIVNEEIDYRFKYDPNGTLTLEEIKDDKSEVFMNRSFNLIGFKPNDRETISDIIKENGGYRTNKRGYDFAIVSDTYSIKRINELKKNGTYRPLQWFIQSVRKGIILDYEENENENDENENDENIQLNKSNSNLNNEISKQQTNESITNNSIDKSSKRNSNETLNESRKRSAEDVKSLSNVQSKRNTQQELVQMDIDNQDTTIEEIPATDTRENSTETDFMNNDNQTNDTNINILNSIKRMSGTISTYSDRISFSLESIFGNIIVYFGNEIDEMKKKELGRYIVAFGGEVALYMNKNVTHFIGLSSIDDHEKEIVYLINPLCKFVKSDWLYLSINQMKLQNVEEFLL